MIVLDTNVVSALMRPTLDAPLLTWITAQRGEVVATTVVTIMEIVYGIERLPAGRRRADLEQQLQNVFSRNMQILDLTQDSARTAARFTALRDAKGTPAGQHDMMIAGIAAEAGAALATRNVRDFQGLGLALHDPWNP